MHGIFLDQGMNPCPCIGRWILNHWTIRKVLLICFLTAFLLELSFTNIIILSVLLIACNSVWHIVVTCLSWIIDLITTDKINQYKVAYPYYLEIQRSVRKNNSWNILKWLLGTRSGGWTVGTGCYWFCIVFFFIINPLILLNFFNLCIYHFGKDQI